MSISLSFVIFTNHILLLQVMVILLGLHYLRYSAKLSNQSNVLRILKWLFKLLLFLTDVVKIIWKVCNTDICF